ncbi:ATP-binding protein [Leptospira noguchii]|uniref:ATP-binding protein n=1 Tax=Leptospira noguchii TaxID=28182 RepID=UPI000387AC46|nr:ATP-binding protein [Leptospira noguchii]AGS80632.1 IstB-like ATP-binding protein [Leptospira phage vB_LnoZ_CZ214-LE1]
MYLTKFKSPKNKVVQCIECGGIGYYLNEKMTVSHTGALSLCSCVTKNCSCKGDIKSNYRIYDRTQNKLIPCECFEKRIEYQKLGVLFKKSGIPLKYQYRTLDQIEYGETIGKSFTKARELSLNLIKSWNINTEKKGIYLHGKTGTGKTLLGCCIINELIFRYNATCKFAKINRDFLNVLKDSYQKESETYGKETQIENEFINVDLLVLDDFGVQNDTDWTNTKIYDLIDSRYENGKITFLTSNPDLEKLKDILGQNIYSRLIEMTEPILLDCEDYRLKIAERKISLMK